LIREEAMTLAMVACMEVGLPAITENTSSRAAQENRYPSNQATTLISAQKVMSASAVCVRIGRNGRWNGRGRASEGRERLSLFGVRAISNYFFVFPAVKHAALAIKGYACVARWRPEPSLRKGDFAQRGRE
jgi:hypothetical protein